MPGRRASQQGEGRIRRAPARFRHPQGQEREQGRARAVRRRQGRAQAHARRVPRQRRCADPGRRGNHRRSLPGRPVRRRHRHQHRQGLRRRHEALEFRRPARLARRVGFAPLDRFDRRPPGPRQDLQEQEDAGPSGHRPRDHAQPARRADRRRARPDHDRGRGSRSQGRLDHRARRGEEGCAEGPAEARQVQGSRGRGAGRKRKAEAAPAAEAPKEGA